MYARHEITLLGKVNKRIAGVYDISTYKMAFMGLSEYTLESAKGLVALNMPMTTYVLLTACTKSEITAASKLAAYIEFALQRHIYIITPKASLVSAIKDSLSQAGLPINIIDMVHIKTITPNKLDCDIIPECEVMAIPTIERSGDTPGKIYGYLIIQDTHSTVYTDYSKSLSDFVSLAVPNMTIYTLLTEYYATVKEPSQVAALEKAGVTIEFLQETDVDEEAT